jgi:NAD(P)-dependent dehydrogenase (short-subunit alcohol dehydrogenase family)
MSFGEEGVTVVDFGHARRGGSHMEYLQGKVAVITGGASGIGKAVAARAAAEGMKVVIADIQEGALKATAQELSAAGADTLAVATDVSDAASVRELRDQTLGHYGAVHLVHNNAGVGLGGPIWEIPDADWRWILGVNLWGVIHGISAFVPLLVEQGEGHVVNTASIAGLITAPFIGPYNATKQAVVAISETLFKDLQAEATGVGVSVLCPGFVQTRIAESNRNRPSWAPDRDVEGAAELRVAMQAMVDGGIPPDAVADRVIEAVRTNTFYILTHPQLRDAIQTRFDEILEGRPPSGTIVA